MLIESPLIQAGPGQKAVIRDQLRQIVAAALQLEPADLDPQVPFMELGASSLALVDAFRAINHTFGVRPAIRKVFDEYDCVDRLADYIVELQATEPAVDSRRLARGRQLQQEQTTAQSYSSLPLTEGQRHLWFLARYSEGAMLAHVHRLIWQLDGDLDSATVQAAFTAVSARHEALRLTLDGDEQRIAAETSVKLELIDLSTPGDAAATGDVAGWLQQESRQPFVLTKSLWRATLARLAPQRHLLVVSMHGLIADQSALHHLVAEVASVYSAALSDSRPALPDPVSFREYAGLTAQQALQPDHEAAAAYWRQQFAGGVPQLDLPPARPRPPVKMYDGARLVIPLDRAQSTQLQSWSRAHKTTPYVILLAAYAAWLQRMSSQSDLVVGLFSRDETLWAENQRLLANRSNPLPWHGRPDPAQSFEGHVQKVQQSLLAPFDHRHYPFATLVRDLNPGRDQSRSAIFSVAFDWESGQTAPSFTGLVARPVTPPIAYTPYDLLLTVNEGDGQYRLQCDYSSELFDLATMRRWMASFKTFLAGCLAAPQEALYRLPLLTAAERRQTLVEWNDTARPYPDTACFHQLIEAQAAATPDSVALVDGHGRLSYGELDRRANQLAGHLQQLGVGRHTFVGVCLDRSVEMMVALLAVLKAGGAYVPLDPAYPVDRLAFMLADAQAAALITQSHHAGRFPEFAGALLCLDQGESLWQVEADTAPQLAAEAGDTAYLIYTSGSTGTPKGVQVSHRNLVNLATFIIETTPITAADVSLATTSLSFDVAVTELFLPLMVGGRVVIVPREDVTDALALAEWLEQSSATLVQATPSHWQMLLDAGWQGHGGLKLLSCGEALRPELARQLSRCGAGVWNWYGPSETTVYSSGGRVDNNSDTVTIGRPIANTQLYVLDEQQQPVLTSVPGELYIGGDGVSPGYWQRPDLTEEKFIANPLLQHLADNYQPSAVSSQQPAGPLHPSTLNLQPSTLSFKASDRLYRTGDLVRYLPNGELDFLGRVDHQVKVKGVRIEPGEIESALNDHPQVKRSVVVARGDEKGLKQLVAYFEAANETAPEELMAQKGNKPSQASPVAPGELRVFLAQKLPDQMMPTLFVALDRLPLTPNGKIDRHALPAPDVTLRADVQEQYMAPRNRIEEIVCKIWCEVLALDRVGVHDSFFDLGGHSLLLTPLVLKLRDYFQLRVSMRDFFEKPTVAELAAMIAKARARQQETGEKDLPASVALAEDGPDVKARFDFLRQEAALDPVIRPDGKPYTPGNPQNILLTGATGFVGAYITHYFMEETAVTLYCLVRAPDEAAGLERIRQQMSRLGLWRNEYVARLRAVPGDVAQAGLALSRAAYERLSLAVDAVLHSAAVVNFIYPYQALKAVNVDGVRHIIEFAGSGRVKPVHYLSTTAVWPMGSHRTFYEDTPLDHDLRLNLAYDETKWVGEKMLQQAAARALPVAVYRPGEVSGDSRTGYADLSHLASAFVKGNLQAGLFPALDSFLDMAPVDYVARAVVHLISEGNPLGGTFHLCNPRPMHARDTYDWMHRQGYTFEVVPFDEWRWRLLAHEEFAGNALYPFAALLEEFAERNLQLPTWDTTHAVRALAGTPVQCPAVDDRLLTTYMDYYVTSGYLQKPK
jgi:myxalamid-type nonribosomal peptide synthetase MxaA